MSVTDRMLAKFNIAPKSLTGFAKRQTKAAMSYILQFEALLAEYARVNQYDGVICGHIHMPDMRNIDAITYRNCGDWVENCRAVVEHHDRRWELLRWRDRDD
jgi:UDP-2,3-diacylglucosamine pyrophosphatase LpxH